MYLYQIKISYTSDIFDLRRRGASPSAQFVESFGDGGDLHRFWTSRLSSGSHVTLPR
jgi:hypothetical protein